VKTKPNREKFFVGENHLREARLILDSLEGACSSEVRSTHVPRLLFLLKTSLSYGIGEAGYVMACLYHKGGLVEQDREMADVYLREGACAEKPSVKALRFYGVRMHRAGNIEEAKALLARSACLGNVEAGLNLATINSTQFTGENALFKALEAVSLVPSIDHVNDSAIYEKIISNYPESNRESLH
jgi:hypothetical protein